MVDDPRDQRMHKQHQHQQQEQEQRRQQPDEVSESELDNARRQRAWKKTVEREGRIQPAAILSLFETSPDRWIPRSSSLIPLTGPHPYNAEPPLSMLASAGQRHDHTQRAVLCAQPRDSAETGARLAHGQPSRSAHATAALLPLAALDLTAPRECVCPWLL